ncbi:hypothetical protein B1C78_08210 [Thioalkalivibrio denitrificans]|uniref:YecA family protein n=1 Tax=Thioalkalivibrio denitrificans TaxID=108003 RepID=A0A1V3NIB5_9GAMM|nr:UPF0149 family protein [Thioalkalivibrio denitrificans]OOG24795.1 hypothetical protein B1C78_08210 [Thioalkalivibrio denitrificans]
MMDFDAVDAAFARAGADTDAAEGHGTLCGMLSINAALPVEDWFRELLPEAEDRAAAEARKDLGSLFEETRAQLNDPNLGFDLLLPEDDEALARRVEALGLWCQGFLYGLSVCGVREGDPLPEDCAEIVRDLADIASTGFEVEQDEQNESAYNEIVEYVRVGVMLVNEELQPMKAPPRLQ